ncbi:MAG TPA: hypothetical protein PK847_08285 [Candidatus Sumerlaeota bacterium]|nr:hypothetical protein [Candidatus Sumerlaeota bacterium]
MTSPAPAAGPPPGEPAPDPVPSAPRCRVWPLLLAIVVLAGMVRCLGLGNWPPGLFRDEAEKGYNAWALATTGGVVQFEPLPGQPPAPRFERRPFMISVAGTRTSAIYQYASIPFVGLGGLSVATTRMAAAAAGTLAVLLLGALIARAWGAPAGLAVAFWLACSPWHLVFSRWALQGIFVPLLMAAVLWGLWLAERAPTRRQGLAGFPLAGFSLGMLYYAYSGASPFALAWGACLLILHRREIGRRPRAALAGLLLFLAWFIPTTAVRLAPGGAERLARIAIWSDPGLSAAGLLLAFLRNYLAHFDPRFLFLTGDAQPRHCIPGTGVLLLADAVLLPIGLVWTIRKRQPLAGALLAALLCAPIPAAITRVGIPHALRAIGMIVPAVAWSGAGLVVLLGWLLHRFDAIGSGAPESHRRGRVYAGLLLLALGGLAFNGLWRYGLHARDPIMQVAFQEGDRRAWQAAADRRGAMRLHIPYLSPFTLYHYLFYFQVPPHQAHRVFENDGPVQWFNPEQEPVELVWQRMAPGEALMEWVDPAWLRDERGRPLLTPAESARAGEAWARLRLKPGN